MPRFVPSRASAHTAFVSGRAAFGSALARVALLALLISPAAPTAWATLRVVPTGVASFTIPIGVAPAAGGMPARITLDYSIDSANPTLGIGWTIAGMPTITRCPRTLAADGVRGVVSHDWNDRFCIDGQRLALVSRVYGDHGAEYRTAGDAQASIRSFGREGAGPAYFLIRTKGGLDLYFGRTDATIAVAGGTLRADGALFVPPGVAGAGTIASWHLALVRDRSGNTLLYEYETDASVAAGVPVTEHRLKRAHYTAAAPGGPSSFGYLQFEYEAAPSVVDVLRATSAGVVFQTTRRLVAVRSYARPAAARAATLVGKRVFVYDDKGPSGRMRLTGIHACEDDCEAPVSPATNARSLGGRNAG